MPTVTARFSSHINAMQSIWIESGASGGRTLGADDARDRGGSCGQEPRTAQRALVLRGKLDHDDHDDDDSFETGGCFY
jgi:hypothetical protein